MKKSLTIILFLSLSFSQNAILKQFSDQFADIAEKVNPAVVTILTEKRLILVSPIEARLKKTSFVIISTNQGKENIKHLPLALG